MTFHVIHDEKRKDRYELLMKEFEAQGIAHYKLFPAIKAPTAIQGISRAHKQIVYYAKENGMPEILIGEDDVKFCGNGSFDYFLKNKPQDFDIYNSGIYFGNIAPDNTTKHFASLHCYIVHQRFYDTFLATDENKNIDKALKDKGRFVVCNPFAAIQHTTFSDNKKKLIDYSRFLNGRKLYGS